MVKHCPLRFAFYVLACEHVCLVATNNPWLWTREEVAIVGRITNNNDSIRTWIMQADEYLRIKYWEFDRTQWQEASTLSHLQILTSPVQVMQGRNSQLFSGSRSTNVPSGPTRKEVRKCGYRVVQRLSRNKKYYLHSITSPVHWFRHSSNWQSFAGSRKTNVPSVGLRERNGVSRVLGISNQDGTRKVTRVRTWTLERVQRTRRTCKEVTVVVWIANDKASIRTYKVKS